MYVRYISHSIVKMSYSFIAHQIRVHLQYLGHPIANDTLYVDPAIWVGSIFLHNSAELGVLKYSLQGPNRGKGGIDLTPSGERTAPVPPSHMNDTSANSKSPTPRENLTEVPTVENEPNTPTPMLLPRETGHDIGAASPVPLSAEAVGIITRLRNMKVHIIASRYKWVTDTSPG